MSQIRTSFAISSCIIFILLLSFALHSTAQNNNCASSTCGNIKISYPFRLTTSPRACGYDGNPSFELECRNNQTIFKVRSATYIVRDINYQFYSIRLVDPTITNSANLSSCPVYSNNYDAWPYIFTTTFLQSNIPVSFISCRVPVTSSNYVEGPFCGNRSSTNSSSSSQIYSYVMVGDGTSTVSGSCMVDKVVWTSGSRGISSEKSSLAAIYDGLGYGVELLWFRALCGDCERKDGFCSLKGTRINCKYYCKEDRPVSQKTFACKLDYYSVFIIWYGLIAIGAFIALKFLIGFPFLVGLVVRKWRSRRYLPV